MLLSRIEQAHDPNSVESATEVTDVKAKLASFDRAGLLSLIQDLYTAHPDNRAFLRTRFRLGANILEPYKQIIDRCLWPDALRKQDTSAAKAKQAISNCKKAVGDDAGLAELMVFYCEQAAGFASDVGYQDESYFDALVRMFEQAMATANTLPTDTRDALITRLDRVRSTSHKLGYRVGDDMDSILAHYNQAQAPSIQEPIALIPAPLHAALLETYRASGARLFPYLPRSVFTIWPGCSHVWNPS